MKNKLASILFFVLAFSLMLTLSSCDIINANNEKPCRHVDSDGDRLCDKCDEPYDTDSENDTEGEKDNNGGSDGGTNGCEHTDTNGDGYCESCGELLSDEDNTTGSTDTHKHSFETVTVPPTCTAEGYDESTCGECGYVEKTNFQDVLEHSFYEYYSYDTASHWFTCRNCGTTESDATHTLNEAGFCTTCSAGIKHTDGITYELSEDGTYASVTGYTGEATDIIIALEYQSKPVRKICDEAFRESAITSVFVPASVTAIGLNAFYDCESLTKVTLPNEIMTVGAYAFYSCESLAFNVSEQCQYLGNEYNPYLVLVNPTSRVYDSYTMHADTRVIADSAFNGCYSMKSFEITDKVVSIGDRAFVSAALPEVYIPKSVAYIGEGAFLSCEKIAKFTVDLENQHFQNIDEHLYTKDGKTLVRCAPASSDYVFFLPDGVTEIASFAVSNFTGIVDVVLCDTLTTIGDSAFYNCTNLLRIEIPDSVTDIGRHAFFNCSSMTWIIIGNGVENIGDDVFKFSALDKIYYKATAEEWAKVNINLDENNTIKYNTVYYYSESEPTSSGRWWYYKYVNTPFPW